MTVVRAWVVGRLRDQPDSPESFHSIVRFLLIESISQNTIGSVFKPEVKH